MEIFKQHYDKRFFKALDVAITMRKYVHIHESHIDVATHRATARVYATGGPTGMFIADKVHRDTITLIRDNRYISYRQVLPMPHKAPVPIVWTSAAQLMALVADITGVKLAPLFAAGLNKYCKACNVANSTEGNAAVLTTPGLRLISSGGKLKWSTR